MIKLNKILEGKQVGMLYHYTSLSYLWKILDSGSIKSSLQREHFAISFTRNKNFHLEKRHAINTESCLVFDGDKLSENYKIVPYDYYFYFPDERKNDEMEEQIVRERAFNIPIKKYIISIRLINNQIKNDKNLMFGGLSLYDSYITSSIYGSTGQGTTKTAKKVKDYIEKFHGIKVEIE